MHRRLCRALRAETHEAGLEDSRYLNMALLAELRRETLRLTAWAARWTTSVSAAFFARLDGHDRKKTNQERLVF